MRMLERGTLQWAARPTVLLWVVLVCAAAVRLHNIDLPGPYYDDVYFSNVAKRFLSQEPLLALPNVKVMGFWFPLTFSPHTGTLTAYIEAAFRWALGPVPSLDRYLNIGYALLSILFMYALGQRIFGKWYGLLFAAILAMLPTFLFWSRVGNHLIFFRCLIAAAWFYFLFRWLETQDAKYFYVMAFVLGLGLSTRIESGWLAVSAAVLVILDRKCRQAGMALLRSPRQLVTAGVLFLAGGLLFVVNQAAHTFPILRFVERNFADSAYGAQNFALSQNLLRRLKHFGSLFEGDLFPEYGAVFSNPLWLPILGVSALLVVYAASPWSRGAPATDRRLARRLVILFVPILVVSTYTPTGLSPKHMVFVIYLPLMMVLLSIHMLRDRRWARSVVLAAVLLAMGVDSLNAFRYHQSLERTGGTKYWSPAILKLVDFADDNLTDHEILIGNWGIAQQLDFYSKSQLQIKQIFGFENGYGPAPRSFFRAIDRALLAKSKPVFVFHGPEVESGFLRREAFLEYMTTRGVAHRLDYVKDRHGRDFFHIYYPDMSTVSPGRLQDDSAATVVRGGSAEQPRGGLAIVRWGPQSTKVGRDFNVQADGQSAVWVITENATRESKLFFGQERLVTVFGSPTLVTASVPNHLYSSSGSYELYLLDRSSGEKSNVVRFLVRP